MYSFRFAGVFRGADEKYLTGMDDLAIRTVDGVDYLLTTTGANGGLLSFRFDATARGTGLTLVDQTAIAQTRQAGARYELVFQNLGGDESLLVAGRTGQQASAIRLGSDGRFLNTTALPDFHSNKLEITFVERGGKLFAFCVDLGSDTISIYSVSPSGRLTRTGSQRLSVGDPRPVDDIELHHVHGEDGADYVLASSASGNNVTAFRVGVNGALSETGHLSATDGLGISGPKHLEAISAWGKIWVLIAAPGSSSVTLAELRADGSLHATDHVIDSLQTRFQQVSDLAVVSVAGRPVVFMGGGDHGVTALEILPDGSLTPVAVQPDTGSSPLTNVSAITAAARDGEVSLFVNSQDDVGLARLTLDLRGWQPSLQGGDSDDSLTGGAGDDLITGHAGDDWLDGGSGRDILQDGNGQDTLTGGPGADSFVLGHDGELDIIKGFEPGRDKLDLSAWGRLYCASSLLITQISDGSAMIQFGGERLRIYGKDGAWITPSVIENALQLELMHLPTGSISNIFDRVLVQARPLSPGGVAIAILDNDMGKARLEGTFGRDQLTGNDFANELRGFEGNDTLDGGGGADTMYGGDGDDFYVVDSKYDRIRETRYGGVDKLNSSVSYHLPNFVEVGRLTGAGRLSLWGNELDNTLYGTANANLLDGGPGDDTLVGNKGNDTLLGGDGDDRIYISSVAGEIAEARGGHGNDTYILGATTQKIIERTGEGIDEVIASGSYDLAPNLENLTLAGSGATNGGGNDLDNRIVGNRGNNHLRGRGGDDYLEGREGADTLEGGVGNDTYVVDSAADVIIELPGEGRDEMITFFDATLTDGVETLRLGGTADLRASTGPNGGRLVGNSGSNRLTGGAGNDTLEGGAGNDRLDAKGGRNTLKGGPGHDVYVVSEQTDRITERPGEGFDYVLSFVSYALSPELEALQLYSDRDISGVGNAGKNRIYGGAGNNRLDGRDGDDYLEGRWGDDDLIGGAGNDTLHGGVGADRMQGGAGNDVYYVDTRADQVIEKTGGGIDRVISSISYTLSVNEEELALTGSGGLIGIGRVQDDLIVGNTGDNLLQGWGGGDTIRAGSGNDTIVGDGGHDVLFGNAGDDKVYAGAGFDRVYGGWGNDLLHGGLGHDRMLGEAHNDTLFGDGGWDTLVGGDGDDLLYGGTENDQVFGGAGSDTLYGEQGNDLMNGGPGADLLYGGEGNDRLRGDNSGDRLIGGSGDDQYFVDVAMPQISEGFGGGTDVIISTISSKVMPERVEHVLLLGTDNLSWVGNSESNWIGGNKGNNSLSGGIGHDTLSGNDGNDRLSGDEGHDRLRGGEGRDTLIGGAGNDTLAGGAGLDILKGGAGADVFEFIRWDAYEHADRITDFSHAHDTIRLGGFGPEIKGGLAEHRFVDGTAAQDADDRIIYDRPRGMVWYDPDGSGRHAPHLILQVTPGTYLDHTDFLFF